LFNTETCDNGGTGKHLLSILFCTINAAFLREQVGRCHNVTSGWVWATAGGILKGEWVMPINTSIYIPELERRLMSANQCIAELEAQLAESVPFRTYCHHWTGRFCSYGKTSLQQCTGANCLKEKL